MKIQKFNQFILEAQDDAQAPAQGQHASRSL